MASLTQWAWVWVNSRNWWWTGRPGLLPFMGFQSWTWLSDWTELSRKTACLAHHRQQINMGDCLQIKRYTEKQVRQDLACGLFFAYSWSILIFILINLQKDFLVFSCFLDYPMDVGNLISGSSAFSVFSLTIWKFTVHVLLKLDLESFEHYFSSVWDERNCEVVWTIFGITFIWDWNEIWPFPVLWPQRSFPNCWHIEYSTFTASSFRIWNSSTVIECLRLWLILT